MTKPKRRDYGSELAAVLDQADRERIRLADHTKEWRGRIAALEKRAKQLRDIIAGREAEELPGVEGATLAAAQGVAARERGP